MRPKNHANKNSFGFLSLPISLVFLNLGGCMSNSPAEPSPEAAAAAAQQNLELQKKILSLETQIKEAGQETLKIQHENQAIQRRLWELSKLMENHSMKLRSGFSFSEEDLAEMKKLSKLSAKSEEGPLPERTPSNAPAIAGTTPVPAGNSKITTDLAEQKIKLTEYGEAVSLLTALDKAEPTLEDNGKVIFLLARCWLALGEPQNTLVLTRRLQARFPNGPFKLSGKLIEAEAQEKLGAKQKSQALYREIIALEPTSELSQKARKALARIREEY
jgi:hypothetical protein